MDFRINWVNFMSKVILFVNVSDENNLIKMGVAKKMGLRIFLVAPALPDWARGFIDKYIQADTTNWAQTINALHEECQDTPFHGVMTILDKSVELVAAIAQEFKLPGSTLAAATTVKHKYKMREALKKQDISHPKFKSVTTLNDLYEAARFIGFPMIFKPVAASTSVAVFKICSIDELEATFEMMVTCERTPYWLYSNEYIAEEFMEGQEISIEGIINNGNINFAGITNKSVDKPGFTEWMHCFPANLEPELCADIYKMVTKAINAVAINNCAFHVEAMLTADGPKIVEINSRMAGAFLASHLVPLASGIDLVKASIQTALGEEVTFAPVKNQYACECNLFAKKNGTIAQWNNIEDIFNQPGVKDFKILRHVNEDVKVPPDGYDNQLCAVITVAESYDDAKNFAENALKSIECVMR